VRVETEQAFLEARSAWQRIAVAEKAVEQAEEGLRIVKNRYNSGLLTIVDLLDSEVTLQRARTRHFQSLHDYKVARIRLALAAGVLDEDFR
jgi:outer membrane protein TolC